jgi:site-specific recombinase XerD
MPIVTISSLIPHFTNYMAIERRFSQATIKKYREDLQWFMRHIGDLPIVEIRAEHFFTIKSLLTKKGAHASRISGVIAGVKALLLYCRAGLHLEAFDPGQIRAPRIPRREVVYLTPEELNQFISAIKLETEWGEIPRPVGYCFRALVETLTGTAMRLSEALSLNRDSIDFEKREAVIIGKGNKQRPVYFTPRVLEWISRYLALRKDAHPPLFATMRGHRLGAGTTDAMFKRLSQRASMAKRVTPHILRHTAATILLRNGCPIGHIKEMLGHEHLITTCRYYLGIIDKAETKRAVERFMIYTPDKNASQTR